MGAISFLPQAEKSYELNVVQSNSSNLSIALPAVAKEGIALEFIEQREDKVVYKLKNTYEGPKTVFLGGLTKGDIFWVSRHEVEDEVLAEVDVADVGQSIINMAAINANAIIESQHIYKIDIPEIVDLKTDLTGDEYPTRAKVNVNWAPVEGNG